MKKCGKCRETKLDEDFSIRKDLADGRFPYCQDCVHEYNRDYYQRNAQKIRDKANTRYSTDESFRLRRAEYMRCYRARKRGQQ